MIEHDILAKIRTLASNATSKENELKEQLLQLSGSLVELCGDIDIDAQSSKFFFWELEPTGDYERGYLRFNGKDGIRVCYRSYDADMQAAENPDPYWDFYKTVQLEDVPIDWLRRSVNGGHVKELLASLTEQLERYGDSYAEAVVAVEAIRATPSAAIESDLIEIAKKVGYTTVVTDWQNAVADIASDPPSAIGRACSLVESTCKHVLSDLAVELPRDQSIRPLYRATANALGLDPEEQAEAELRGLCGGLATVAQQIGTLRTKFSIAHGRGPDSKPLTSSHARLAVNAAGNIATFLMEQWQARTSGATGSASEK